MPGDRHAASQVQAGSGNAHTSLNGFIIHVSLPALTLLQIHNVKADPALFYVVLMPWLLFAGSAILFWWISRRLSLSRPTIGALTVVGGLGNTSFIGLPMIESFYGPSGMPTGIIIDQLGTYLVLSTLGFFLICFYSESVTSGREVLRRIVTFPPLIALVVGVALIPVEYPAWAEAILKPLGQTLAPLALVSVGLQLRLGELRGNRSTLAMGLGYKLVAAPLMVMLVYAGIVDMKAPSMQVMLFESGMAPQIGASIVAIQYGLNAQLISLMVGVGTLVSFVTLPIWWRAFAFL